MITWDFAVYCREHKIEYREAGQHHHASEGWTQVNCPWCRTTNFHLGIREGTTAMNCWLCGPRSLWEWMVKLGLNPRDSGAFNRVVMRSKRLAKVVEDVSLPRHCGDLKMKHRRFLENRGFSPELLTRQWGLLATDSVSDHPLRIIIPVKNQEMETIGWTGRAIVDAKAKYITAKNFKAHNYLYGIEQVKTPWVVVVEGPVDVWRLGFSAVALFGAKLSTSQVKILKTFRHVHLLLDADAAGRAGSGEARDSLSLFTNVIEHTPADYSANDPGEFTRKNTRKFYESVLSHWSVTT